MPHRRQEITDAIKAALTGATDVAIPIDVNRMTPVMADDLPRIVIRTPKEVARIFAEAPRVLERRLLAVIEVLAQGDDSGEMLDEIAQKAEAAMNASSLLSGRDSDHVLFESEMEIDATGDSPVGSLKLKYEIRYMTEESPEQLTSDLGGINVRVV